jgi:hypothetical protein
MRYFSIFAISCSFLLFACQSNQTTQSPQVIPPLAATAPPIKDATSKAEAMTPKLTLESVAQNWNISMSSLKGQNPEATKGEWQDEIHRICQKQDNLCETSTKGHHQRDRFDKKAIREMSENILEGRFDVLKDYSVDKGLKFFSRLKKAKLLDYADVLFRDKDCRAPDLKHALASTLEDELPDFEIRNTVQGLYEQNSECPTTKTTASSAYRAAMLRLLDQDCAKAIPLLEKVTTSNEDYLKPRSMYWSWKCQGQSAELKAQYSEALPYFSYHRILMTEGPEIQPTVASTEETPTLNETAKNPNLNEVAKLAEGLMANDLHPAARAVLEKIKIERVLETEPEFQVYWARLLNLNQAGIKKFQILSSLINSYPQFRTHYIQNMLFPTAFFDQVEANAKLLDPWLVQSLIRQESAFDPQAKSRVGALGLMQLMPSTARRIAKMRGQLRDPEYNVHAGVLFLENLLSRFDGQIHLALAAYNAGPIKVEEWVKRYPTNDPTLFVDTIPYRETREYVAFILRNYHWYRTLNLEADATPEEPTMLAKLAQPICVY